MSMEDPFFVVKGEVQKAVNAARSLHQRWEELRAEGGVAMTSVGGVASKEEMDWTTNELRNSLRSIDWDLEDLEETISIVESNPKKFNLDSAELLKRKGFISATRQSVKEMKEQMTGASGDKKNRQALFGEAGGPARQTDRQTDRFSGLDQSLSSANSLFIQDQQTQQQLISEQQDDQLQLVSGTIGVLKNMSERIGMELDEQSVMLDDFTHEVDTTHSRLDNVMKKLAKVSHMNSDRRQWCAIAVLLGILFVVILLFFLL